MVALASSPAVPRAPRPPLALSPTASVIKTEQLRRSYNGRVLFTLRDFRREDFETLWRIDQSCFPPGISYITIDVVPSARRFGVGSKLLAAAEERLQSEGVAQVFLEAAVDNKTALAFYKRHDYFVVKTVPRYYSNGLDAFVLQKDLLPSPTSNSLALRSGPI